MDGIISRILVFLQRLCGLVVVCLAFGALILAARDDMFANFAFADVEPALEYVEYPIEHPVEEFLHQIEGSEVDDVDRDASNESDEADTDEADTKDADEDEASDEEDVDPEKEEEAPRGGWEDDAPAKRYREGRLVIADFAMDPPEERDLDAMLATQLRIHFEYRCEYGPQYGGGARADVTMMDIFAVIRPEESWTTMPENKRLLDHEQGHFDVAQIAAISAKLSMHEKWKAGKLAGSAPEPQRAIEKLRENIQAEMEPYYAKLKAAQQEYDQQTSHGRWHWEQRNERKKHARILKMLNKYWEESKWYKKKRRRAEPSIVANVSEQDESKENDSNE